MLIAGLDIIKPEQEAKTRYYNVRPNRGQYYNFTQFLNSLHWDFLLCLCAQNRMYLKTLGRPKLAMAKILCSTFDCHSALEWRVRYLFCPAHDKMYDDTGLVTGHCTALDEVPQIRR